MNCPRCPQTTLLMTERSGVEIDYCPTCRGMWLDRQELEKILDRAAAGESPQARRLESDRRRDDDDDDDDDDRGFGRGPRGNGDGRRRGGFFGELFDWG